MPETPRSVSVAEGTRMNQGTRSFSSHASSVVDADGFGERLAPRKARVVIAEHDDHARLEKAITRESRPEIFQCLIEESHCVQVVSKGGSLARPQFQNF